MIPNQGSDISAHTIIPNQGSDISAHTATLLEEVPTIYTEKSLEPLLDVMEDTGTGNVECDMALF